MEAADTPPPSARAEARPTPPWGALWADGRVGRAHVVDEGGKERTGTKANGGDRERRRERHARGFRGTETTDGNVHVETVRRANEAMHRWLTRRSSTQENTWNGSRTQAAYPPQGAAVGRQGLQEKPLGQRMEEAVRRILARQRNRAGENVSVECNACSENHTAARLATSSERS